MSITTASRSIRCLMVLGLATALMLACSQPSPPPTPTTAQQVAPSVPTRAPVAAVPTAQQPATAPTSQKSPAAAASGQVKDVSFVVVDGTEVTHLDPPQATAPFGHIIHALYDGLVEWNEKMELEPALATSWTPSEDGTVWTFKLRQGVKFHDGTPFNSQAVKVTFEHLLDKETVARRAANYALIKDIATPDDHTVKFTIDPPSPDFPFLMADRSCKIISPTALEKYGKDFVRNPVGTGPFKFEEWVPNSHVSAVINPDYWGPKPQVRRFVYKSIPEPAARVIALKTGEADVVINLPPADVENLKNDPNLMVQTTPGLTIIEAEPRQTKPPFNDVRVRYALNMAIDKDAIISKIMRGLARPLNSPSIPGLWGSFEFEPVKYDPEKAKQLLAEAGYPNGIDITLNYVSGRWAGDDQVAEALQGYWANVGIRTKINKIAQAELGPGLREDPDKMAGQLFMIIKTSEYTDYHIYRMYHSDATLRTVTAQHYGYSNPEVDKLIELEQRTYDPEKRLQIFKQLQELVWKDQPLVYIFHQVNIWGQSKNVSGFKMLPNNELVPGPLQKN